MTTFAMPEDLKAAITFHGHICPGLIIGYRAAKLAAKDLDIRRDKDEELVAVVENDACGVDAIQWLLGCTIGKGNLIFRDQGKHAFTIFRRDTGKAVRLVYKGQAGANTPEGIALRKRVMEGTATTEEKERFEVQKNQRMREMMEAADEELFDRKQPSFPVPERARIFDSFTCEECGEVTMEPRLRLVAGKKVCLACAEPYHRGW
jgi:formylmethanofuran dehydrogenase subunit E